LGGEDPRRRYCSGVAGHPQPEEENSVGGKRRGKKSSRGGEEGGDTEGKDPGRDHKAKTVNKTGGGEKKHRTGSKGRKKDRRRGGHPPRRRTSYLKVKIRVKKASRGLISRRRKGTTCTVSLWRESEGGLDVTPSNYGSQRNGLKTREEILKRASRT